MRIFWLGAHKLLVKTELVRLRTLGYEVFNPPYNTPVPDQSSQMNWDSSQPTSLPPHIFEKLSKYNFFYNSIDEEITEILNKYFDAVVVTIHPWWLSEVLRVYKGKVIYRTYGQLEILSEELVNYEGITQILNRDNFYFLPFHEKTITDEDQWLKDKATVVPYCLDPSIYTRTGDWNKNSVKNRQMMVTCPNINNPFYLDHYNFLKKNFPEDHYLFFGVQLAKINDAQVVGTIAYERLQKYFSESAGFLYTYPNPRVCYLPPIEMMVVGGPALYTKGCLLDRMILDGQGHGAYSSIEEAKALTQRLFEQDHEFIRLLQKEQENVAQYYNPEYVWPIFDKIMKNILESKPQQKILKNEVTVVGDYRAARNYANSKDYQNENKVLTKQDVLEKVMLFRLERRFRMNKVRNSVVAFSKRIEEGEFVRDLIEKKATAAAATGVEQKAKPRNRVVSQCIYLLYRVKDRIKLYLSKVKTKVRSGYYLIRRISFHVSFLIWLSLNIIQGKKVRRLN